MRRSLTRRPLSALGLVVLMSAACGIGTEAAPHHLDRQGVPFGLLAPATTTTTPTTEPVAAQVTIYLEATTQKLVAVARKTSMPPTIQDILEALSAGPTSTESSRGLTSPISSASPIKLDAFRAGNVSVDVPASFESLGGQDQIVAAGQLVYSLTGLPGVTGVVLLVAGQPTQVPTSGGSLSSGPLTRNDYVALATG